MLLPTDPRVRPTQRLRAVAAWARETVYRSPRLSPLAAVGADDLLDGLRSIEVAARTHHEWLPAVPAVTAERAEGELLDAARGLTEALASPERQALLVAALVLARSGLEALLAPAVPTAAATGEGG